MKKNLTRRDFIQGSAKVAAGTGLASALPVTGSGSTSWAQNTTQAEGIPTRTLGATGEQVTSLWLGGAHIGLMKNETEAMRLIHKALDMGVTCLDNAWMYADGLSEERFGKALAGGKRDQVFLMSKVLDRTADGARQQLEDSLRRLQTDHLDLWQFHSLWNNEEVETLFGPGGAFETAMKAKAEGKVRYIGLTGHRRPHVFELVLEKYSDDLDALQFPINCIDPHFQSFVKRVLPRALEKNLGVLAMKTLAYGNLPARNIASVADCLRYAWSFPVSGVVSGIDSEKILDMNVKLARTFTPMNEKQMEDLVLSTINHAGIDVEIYKNWRA